MTPEKLETSAIIIQRPTDVVFDCPCCNNQVVVPFEDVQTIGGIDCSECGTEVYLDDFEVD